MAMTQPAPAPPHQRQSSNYRAGQGVPPPPPPPPPPQRSAAIRNAYGEDIDEAGGIGDEMDTISLRDVASVRYVRYHEWMELVLGSAIDTRRIVPPKVIPEETKDWSFADKESLEKKLKEVEAEVRELEETKDDNKEGQESHSLSKFYDEGISRLREKFGSTDSDNTVENRVLSELEETFPGRSIIEKKRARRVGTDLSLPEPKEQPEEVTKYYEQQRAIAEQQEKERLEQEERERQERERQEEENRQRRLEQERLRQEQEEAAQQDSQQLPEGQGNHDNDDQPSEAAEHLELHNNTNNGNDNNNENPDAMDISGADHTMNDATNGPPPQDDDDVMNMLDQDVPMNDADLGDLLNMPHSEH